MYRFLLLLIVFSQVFAACEEPFERPSDLKGGQVVIYGRVSNLPNDTQVEIGITKNSTSKPIEVEGAEVFIYDVEGAEIELCEKRPGIYVPVDSEFRGRVGLVYDLGVRLPDGREFAAHNKRILPPTRIDSAYVEFEKKQVIRETIGSSILDFMVLSIDIDFIDISEEKFVRWDLEEMFTINQTVFPNPTPRYFTCFVDQNMSLQKLNLASTSAITDTKVERVYLGDRLVDYAFGIKHATVFYQRSIDEDTYNYWKDIEKVATISGSIFDNPPAPVFGNIESVNDKDEIVIGYFEATGSSLRRVFTYGAEMEEKQEDPCLFSGFNSYYPAYCINCLNHPNSSYFLERWFGIDEEF